MIKDHFTRAELIEFTIGALTTLLFSFGTIAMVSSVVPVERLVIMLICSIVVCVLILWIRKMDHPIKRIISALVISSIVSIAFFVILIGTITISQLVIAVSASTIGAMTIDVLRDDN